MTCSFDRNLLQEFAIGEVAEEERERVKDHLLECAHCRSEVAEFRQMARDLAALPEPEFPASLEEILVRASMQACRDVETEAAAHTGSRLQPAVVLAIGSAAGVTILVLLVMLLWPGRLTSWQPGSQTVGGGAGQGLGLLDSLLRLAADLRATWEFILGILARFAPVERAVSLALSRVGGSIWAALALGALSATLLVWRITSVGKKTRRVGHAKPNC